MGVIDNTLICLRGRKCWIVRHLSPTRSKGQVRIDDISAGNRTRHSGRLVGHMSLFSLKVVRRRPMTKLGEPPVAVVPLSG